MKQERFNLVWPSWLKEAATKAAKERGVSIAEYIKDLIKRDLTKDGRK